MSMPSRLVAIFGGGGPVRRVKHRKLTAEQWAVLEREAEIRSRVTRNKIIAQNLGVTELYVAHAISRLIKERRGHVPRVTHSFALCDETQNAKIAP